jgi:multiple sugar transport system substrate-binding protein
VTERLVLRGITWDHPRGLQPLLATAGAYAAHADGVVVEWEARSLLGFGEDPLEVLAGRYDLLVIDHPFVGEAASLRCWKPWPERRSGRASRATSGMDSSGPCP